jgi:YVTN family beta-propeller protein
VSPSNHGVLRLVPLVALAVVPACHGAPGSSAAQPQHSSTMALTSDGQSLFVVNPDSDSVSVVDVAGRRLVTEIALGAAPPAADPTTGVFLPNVMPRALALSPDGKTLWVTGERAGSLFAVDVATAAVRGSVAVGAEPVGVVAGRDAVFVSCASDATVVRVDAASLTVAAELAVGPKPWALALSADGATLWATHLTAGAVDVIDTAAMTLTTTIAVADVAPRGDRRLAHGQPRGLYDLAPRPGGGGELWLAHELLGTDTSQPTLDFESTAFPALTIVGAAAAGPTLSTDAADVPGTNGAFLDVVSGPRALTFTSDGAFALVVDAHSEDVFAVDAARRVESELLRPLPGHQPEGIVLSPDGRFAYVDERNSGDVVVIDVDAHTTGISLTVDGAPISRLQSDPMPAQLRLGQHLFHSANSDEYPLTQNHWIACATCHMEGRSDAVTWKFAQGPRDTPSNAGGMLGTGFLFRTADRTRVQDYWHTINVEQGGHFADPSMNPAQVPLLDALAAYVNLAIPLPVPPKTDPTLVAAGQAVFARADVGCASCHTGPRFTDSGAGNPTLDLTGMVTLHDVGTCAAGDWPDVAHLDLAGDARAACAFDTPSLNGVADSAPYLHDGSAATLADAVDAHVPAAAALLDADRTALFEFLRSL